jgi:hypothetical protein
LTSSCRDSFKVPKVCKAESSSVIERVCFLAIVTGFFFGAFGGFKVDPGEGGGVKEGILNSSERTRGGEAKVSLEVRAVRCTGTLWLIAEVSAIFSPFVRQMFSICV